MLGHLNFHMLRTNPTPPFLPFIAVIGQITLKTAPYNHTVIPLYHFSIHLNHQFTHPEDVGSRFLQSVRTFNHYTVQKPKRKSLLVTPTVLTV